MSELESIRRAVSATYARSADHATSTAATRRAGYTDAQLAQVPDDVGFFGCGNPLAFAAVRPGQTVLDLGSGAGFDLILAANAVGPGGRVIGVDMTAAMLERARANVERAGLANVELREGLIEALPVADGAVDWVISNCVISLSPEKERVFAEVARVLRPGGEMVISDIVVDEPLAWLLQRLVRVAPSIAMARTEASYLAAMTGAGLAAPEVLGRYVYEADELVGLFADDVAREAAAACPVAALRDRVVRGPVGRGALRLAARAAAGHVWSSKFRARRAT